MAVVTKFRAGWNPKTHQGKILVYSQKDSQELVFNNPAEFSAVLQILSTADQVGVDENWTIWTSLEDVDGELA